MKKKKTEREFWTKEELKRNLESCRLSFKSWLPEESEYAVKHYLNKIYKNANKRANEFVNSTYASVSGAKAMTFDHEFLDRLSDEFNRPYSSKEDYFFDRKHYQQTGKPKYVKKKDVSWYKRFSSRYVDMANSQDKYFALFSR